MATKKKMFRSAADIMQGNDLHLAVLRSAARNMGQDDLATGKDARQIFRDLCFRYLDGMETTNEDRIERMVLDEVNFMAEDA